ncbi:winged helix-turn-helix domain-containing protein [Phenylobacterium sp.]|uniref:winged helix-turn-helix domain-containing protein n=1 Tax=Phenylobacterium sp. TaxID=1871053 RepID=UPI001200F96D|nr:winged helix-turn-helix domain-containing protein [Phenylobacterium sp.]THD65959.1 MAG: hypothetical protein E8A12_06510 [Phenylobacterium sp.]
MDDGGIVLADIAPFRLGGLRVDPPNLSLTGADGAERRVQARVMQVLVALSQAQGATLSRERLNALCWGGVVVGAAALDRIVSLLRQLAAETGGAFAIETIPRVGYRLIGATATPVGLTAQTDMSAGGASATADPLVNQRRRLWRFALAGLLLLVVVAAGSWVFRDRLGLFPTARQVVEVETFTPTGPGLTPGLPAELRAEVVDFLANDRFFSVAATAPRRLDHPKTWRVRGTVAPAERGARLHVFAELLKPGSDNAVAELRLDRDVAEPMLTRSLGLRIGRTADCILLAVTDKELTGGYRESALPALSAACVTWHDKTTSLATRMSRFRDAAAALPRSAYFRARLAEMLGDQAAVGGANAEAARAEGLGLVSVAKAIDPSEPHIPLALARLRPPFDFVGREALLKQALAGRPSDCACEFGDYSNFLSAVGRNAEAQSFGTRASEQEPKNIPWLRRAGEAAAAAGDFAAAKTKLAAVAGFLPEPGTLDQSRLFLGLWSRDWTLAQAMAARMADGPAKSAELSLIAALAAGTTPDIRRAGAGFLRLPEPGATSRAAVVALAMAGLDRDAVAAAARLIGRNPIELSILFEPSFASARRTPEFATLADRLGLIDYWRRSGHSPDFCVGQSVPTICATFGRAN